MDLEHANRQSGSTSLIPEAPQVIKHIHNQRGRLLLIISVVFIVAIALVGLFLYKNHATTNKIPKDQSEKFQPKEQQEVLNIGIHSILLKRNSVILLPSGSKIDLGTFYFDKDSRDYENNSISLVKSLKVSHKGYIYNISKSNCSSESVWHGDYSTQELKECTVDINISRDKSEIIPYAQFTKKFSSIERSYNSYNPVVLPPSPITSGQNEPFLTIIPPYIQLYRDSGLQRYTYSIPIGDTVWVYTNYGYKKFKFNLPEDLFNKVSKTEQIGPLTVILKVEGLSCYPPFMRSTGECNNSGEYPVYNKVDFVISISQDNKIPAEIKILDYKW